MNTLKFLFFLFVISASNLSAGGYSDEIGSVPSHEWTSSMDASISTVNEKGEKEFIVPENLTTWIFEDGTFIPMSKLQDGKSYSIITDHLRTPNAAKFKDLSC